MANMDAVLVAQVAVLQAAGWTQAEIGEKVGKSQQTVSRYSAFLRGACAPLWDQEVGA